MLKTKKLYLIFLLIATMLLLAALLLMLSGQWHIAGPVIITALISLAVWFSGFATLQGLVFPTIIFAGVSIALFYPQCFLEAGGFKFTELIVPLIQVIMFGMGTSMSIRDFAAVFQSPRGVLIGLSAQLLIMPVIGFLLASLSALPPEIAAGIVLVGCSPSGVASNVMAYLARANLALSITITAVSTLLAPLTTPLLMKLLAGEFIAIDVLSMMWSIIRMILIPISAGLLVNRLFRQQTDWLNKLLPLISMSAIAVIIMIITAAGRDSLLDLGLMLLLIVLIHNLLGYLLGYYYAKLLRMSEQDCRTIAIEVGMQNSGLASGIANTMGRIATMGLAPAVFGPMMNITGSLLAAYWHKRIPNEQVID